MKKHDLLRVYAVHDITGFFSDAYACFIEDLNKTHGISVVKIDLSRFEEITQIQGGIKDLANANLKHFTSEHPADTPFVLVGHSSGGLIAYEMALQLQGRSNPVTLYMLDSHSPNLLQDLEEKEKKTELDRIINIIEKAGNNSEKHKKSKKKDKKNKKRFDRINTAKCIWEMEQIYQPEKVVKNAYLCRSNDPNETYSEIKHLGWENLKHQIKFPGNHYTILKKDGELYKYLKRQIFKLSTINKLMPIIDSVKRDHRQQFEMVKTLAAGNVHINKFSFNIQSDDKNKENKEILATKYLPTLFSEKKEANICVFSKPGLGSTTLLKKFAYLWAKDEQFLPQFELVVYLNVPSWEIKSMSSLIAEQYNIIDNNTIAALQHFLFEYSDSVLYLLESDQALTKLTLPHNDTYKSSSLIIAKSHPKLDKHTMVELLHLRPKQIDEFVVRAGYKPHDVQAIRNTVLGPLLEVPCLLDILLHTWNAGSLIKPNGIEPLILSIWNHLLRDSNKAISILIDDHFRRSLDKLPPIYYKRCLELPYKFITELAKATSNKKLTISEENVIAIDSKCIESYENTPKVFLSQDCRRLLFFDNPTKGEDMKFRHPKIREYFFQCN